MPTFRHKFRGEIKDWDEHLYHKSLTVVNGETTTSAELDIDHLGRRGWVQVSSTTTTAAPTTTTAPTTTAAPTTTTAEPTTTTAAPEGGE